MANTFLRITASEDTSSNLKSKAKPVANKVWLSLLLRDINGKATTPSIA